MEFFAAWGMAIVLICGLWLAVTCGRSGTGWAVLGFVFPLGTIPLLIRNWGTPDDIKLPFFAVVLASGLWWHSANQVVRDLGIDPNDPAQVEAMIAQEMARAYGLDPSEFAAEMGIPQQTQVKVDPAHQKLAWAHATASLSPLRGTVDLPEIGQLNVPTRFRFYDRGQVLHISGALGEPVDETVLGWAVHEEVDMTDFDSVWMIELSATREGRVERADFAGVDSETLRYEAVSASGEDAPEQFSYGPRVETGLDRVVWSEQYRDAADRSEHDCHALRLGRHGAVRFSLHAMPASRHELCVRAARLLAGALTFADGKAYDDWSRFRDSAAPYSARDLVTGRWTTLQ